MPQILVVDDDERWRQKLSQILQRAGYEVCTAGTFAEAEQALRTRQCHMALLDIDLDGSKLAGEGGQLFDLLCYEYPTIPVVAVTGTDITVQNMRDLFVECGIKDFVTKDPFTVTAFRKLIARILSSRSSRLAPPPLLSAPVDPRNPPIGPIRALLHAAFSEQELSRFCLDRELFRPICDLFAAADGLAEKVDKVLEYCRTHLLWDELLTAVAEVNPRQYAAFVGQVSRLA